MKEYGKRPLYRTFPTLAIVPQRHQFGKQHGGAAITPDLFFTTPQNKEVIQPELPWMAVVSLVAMFCVHAKHAFN